MTEILHRNLAPSPDAVESAVGDETVILHLVSGTYYGLDAMGTRVWAMLKNGLSPAEICRHIADEHGLDLAEVEQDVGTFLSDLTSHEIVIDV